MRATIRSNEVRGHDGVAYHVITVVGTGRGWHGRCLYAAKGETVLAGTVLDRRDLGKGTELLVRLDDASVPVQEFSEKPYVSRTTGIRNPHVPTEFNDPRPLSEAYGVWDGRAWFRERDVQLVD